MKAREEEGEEEEGPIPAAEEVEEAFCFVDVVVRPRRQEMAKCEARPVANNTR